ncbi:MAG: hypothetical protein QGI45_02530 [Myxococcota bacterium]|jgi:hypothetical protein|nr:hypothetical protein [Myxococcota bacterium]
MASGETTKTSLSRIQLIYRIGAFVLLSAFMAFGPFYRQVLKKRSIIFRQWTPYHGIGWNVCDAQWYYRNGQEINRYKLLKHKDKESAPKSLRHLKTMKDVNRVTKQLCNRVEDKHVRLKARCGSGGSWVEKDYGKKNLCKQSDRRNTDKGRSR